MIWKLIPLAIFWSICKEIIEIIVSDSDSSLHDIINAVLLKIGKWAMGRK